MNLCDVLNYPGADSVVMFMGKDLRECSREELYAIVTHLGRSERAARERYVQSSIEHIADISRMAKAARRRA